MDFKYINDRNKTPNSKLNVKLTSSVSCDSPFRNLPNYSTPPSRFTKIVNPFEQHLIDRLHLPTFSPSVFAKVSTPKTEEKFKWSIDDISSLKPADIDEGTISQHVFEHDPHVESLFQQRIDTFFNEKVIVPSPMTEVVRVPLVTKTDALTNVKATYSDGSAQTILTLPPILPKHVEEALTPYFTYTEDQQKNSNEDSNIDIKNNSLYRQLFEFDQEPSSSHTTSNQSSPAHSTGLSPLHLSPLNSLQRSLHSPDPDDMPELRDCTISPICGKSPKECRSACRLDFSRRISMSIEASVVPDIANQMSTQSIHIDTDHSPQPIEFLSDSTVNWDMEYKHVSLISPNDSGDSDKMDICNPITPHSKIFTSQRKRLSDSFKDIDESNKENEPLNEYARSNRKLFRSDTTDAGYQSQYDESSIYNVHVFASTPSKRYK